MFLKISVVELPLAELAEELRLFKHVFNHPVDLVSHSELLLAAWTLRVLVLGDAPVAEEPVTAHSCARLEHDFEADWTQEILIKWFDHLALLYLNGLPIELFARQHFVNLIIHFDLLVHQLFDEVFHVFDWDCGQSIALCLLDVMPDSINHLLILKLKTK